MFVPPRGGGMGIDMKKKSSEKKIAELKAACFFGTLFAVFFVGLMWFLRPSVSETEKRELAEFPKFTIAGLIDGSYAKGVDLWYSDTFPAREFLVSMSAHIHSLYGDRSSQFINKGEQGDDIPDPIPPVGDETDPPETDSPGTDPTETDETEGPSETGEPPVTSTPVTDPPETNPPETNPPETDPPETAPPGKGDGNNDVPGEMAGSIYLKGDAAFGIYYFNKKRVDSFAEMMNRTYDAIDGKANLYCLVAPISSGVVLDKSVLDKLGGSDQSRAISYVYSLMKSGIKKISVCDALSAHKNEYIYFRTDHHWTALGSYYAFCEFAKTKGIKPYPLSSFETRTFEGFLGTYYASSQSQRLKNNPDTVTAYVPMGTNSMKMVTSKGENLKWNIIRNVEKYGAGVKYSCFSGADQPFAEAHNPNITDGSTCVVVKDSYGNAFIPWLIDQYEHVYWIDFRYYKDKLPDLIAEVGADDVIYVVNIYNVSSVANIKKMNGLVG